MVEEYSFERRTATLVLAGCLNLLRITPEGTDPYDVPEIVALKPEQVAEAHARWVTQSVS
jgi:hypothetical protein